METSQHAQSASTGVDAGAAGAAAINPNEHGQQFLNQYNELTDFTNQDYHGNINNVMKGMLKNTYIIFNC